MKYVFANISNLQIEVGYLFTAEEKMGDFKGRVNGKTVAVSISRETGDDGSEKMEMKMDSPLENANHVEAEFEYHPEGKIDFELKSDKLYLEIKGWQKGFEFELESVPYDIKVDFRNLLYFLFKKIECSCQRMLRLLYRP